jgi:hypothetical protein
VRKHRKERLIRNKSDPYVADPAAIIKRLADSYEKRYGSYSGENKKKCETNLSFRENRLGVTRALIFNERPERIFACNFHISYLVSAKLSMTDVYLRLGKQYFT